MTGGPGTGKSSLFAERLNYLLRSQLISPNELLVITFCESQKQFIKAKLPNAPITSLDEWCLDRLKHHYRCIKRRDNFFIISDQDKTYIINKLTNSHKEAELKSRQIKAYKQGVPKHLFPASFFSFFDYYQLECQRSNAIDCDDLCFLTKQLLQENPQLARLYQEKIKPLKEKEFDQNKLTSLLINIIENKDNYLNKKNNLEKFCYQNSWNNINEKVISSLNEN